MESPKTQSRVTGVKRKLLVGSRGSSLALRQTEEVLERLRALHGETTDFEVRTVITSGDAAPEAPLASLDQGIFVSEIERALLEGKIALAVHSLKDMTTEVPEGLVIGAVCRRLDARDVLVNRWDCSLEELPAGARIGTSSPRRAAQLKSLRPGRGGSAYQGQRLKPGRVRPEVPTTTGPSWRQRGLSDWAWKIKSPSTCRRVTLCPLLDRAPWP